MKINVGSTNPTKIKAIKNLVKNYSSLKGAKVTAVDVMVEEFGHPKSVASTISGAKSRAQLAFLDCKFSFGIESGLIKAPGTKSGYLETTACAIYDGKKFYIGLGPSYEWPQKIIDLIFAGKDGSQAFKTIGLTNHPKIGAVKGAIHVFSKGKIDRTKLNELATMMAMVSLENPKHY